MHHKIICIKCQDLFSKARRRGGGGGGVSSVNISIQHIMG